MFLARERQLICHSEGYSRGVASNHGDVMHWSPKFGKNMDGFRADVSRELKGDEDDMTQEQFNQMMAEYERTKNPVPDNTPEDWEAPAVQWARDNGLLAGDGAGNLMLHSNMTRAQFLVMLKKYHEKKTKFGEDIKEKYFSATISTTRTHRNARFCISFSSSQGKKKVPKVLENQGFRGFFE